MAVDFLCVQIALWMAITIRPTLNTLSFVRDIPESVNPPIALYIIAPLVWVAIFSVFAIYDGRKNWRVVDEFAILTMATFIASISIAGILYLSYRDLSRALFMVFIILAYVLFLIWRGTARIIFRHYNYWPDVDRRVLVVGTGSLSQRVHNQIMESGICNLTFTGFLTIDPPHDESAKLNILGSINEICEIVKSNQITDVIMAVPHSKYQAMDQAVNLIAEEPVKVWVALGFFDLALYRAGLEDFAGVPMVDLRAPALSDYQRMIKRAFDILIGSLILVMTLPVMGLIAIVIIVDSGGPVLFRQKRAGENGHLFEMYKFRTMIQNAEHVRNTVEHIDQDGNLIHKARHDHRVTVSGRFLRRFSLDELPQLFNVLQGTMSLVGPRPELPHLVEKYQSWQRKRFAVPPGITGWWQINGRSERIMHLHTEDDLYYINHYSIGLDLLILTRTLWAVVLGKGAY